MGLCAALALASGCGDDGGSPATDAAANHDAQPGPDALVNRDAVPSLGWVDFTITGCASGGSSGDGTGDAGVLDPCVGPAPLTLQLTAVAPSPIDVYRWSFDGVEVMEATPVHTFATPGSFDVVLTVGGPGGTAMASKPAIIMVVQAPLGNHCSADEQCASGDCICDSLHPCTPGLAAGMCSQVCDSTTPCADGVCVDLAPGGGGSEDWQQKLCVPSCTDSSECPSGLACRQLLDASGSWVSGCFAADVLGDIGASCEDPGGVPDATRCTSGVCLGEGARGVCSQPCSANTCPSGSACAAFNAQPTGSWCMARCDSPSICDSDPWLACESPGGSGNKGFSVDESMPDATYCAPKTCTGPNQCGPSGACMSGFCAPAP